MELVSVMLANNPRRAIRRALAAGTLKAAIVPTGSTKRPNERLAMSHDTDSAVHIARRVAEALRPAVVVTPPLAFGLSEHWMEHKGTVTLTPTTFRSVLHDTCDSLRRHGIRNVLILNGHAGNGAAAREVSPALREELGIRVDFCSYWEAYTSELAAERLESGECPAHAAEFETSFARAAFPQNAHFAGEPYPAGELAITDPRRSEDDRRYHRDARLATAAKGSRMSDAAVAWVAARLRAMMDGNA